MKRILTFCLLSLLTWTSPPARADEVEAPKIQTSSLSGQDDAFALIELIVKARGGYDTLKRHDKMVRRDRGTFRWTNSTVEPLLVEDLYLPEGRRISTYQSQDYAQKLVEDGQHGWYGACGIHYRSSKAEMAEQNYFNRHSARHALVYKDYTTAELRPQSTLDGIVCDVIVLQMIDTDPLEIWADAKSHMIVQTKFQQFRSNPRNNPQKPEVVQFRDFTSIDGEMIPRSVGDVETQRLITDLTFEDGPSAAQIEGLRFPAPALERAVIPFKMFHGHIVTYGKINGAPVLFEIDTGAVNTSMDSMIANFGHVKKGSSNGGSIGLFSTNLKGFNGVAKTFTVGKYDFADIPVSIHKEDYSRRTVLLGMNFLRQYCVTIDFKARKLLLERNAPEIIPSHAVVIPFSLYHSIYLNGHVGGEAEQQFLFDTGMDDAIWLQDEPRCFVLPSLSTATDTHYERRVVRRGQVPTASVAGKINLVHPEVYLLSPDSPLKRNIFGLKIVSDFQSIILDFENERMICIPWGDGAHTFETQPSRPRISIQN